MAGEGIGEGEPVEEEAVAIHDEVAIHLIERRAQISARRKQLARGATPITPTDAREFLTAFRQNLDPMVVGASLAQLFNHAVASRDFPILRMLLPYVLGKPPEDEDARNGSLALQMLMNAMKGEKDEGVLVEGQAKRSGGALLAPDPGDDSFRDDAH